MKDQIRELRDDETDIAQGGSNRFDPYKNFKFRVQVDSANTSFDGKLLTASDLSTEQKY